MSLYTDYKKMLDDMDDIEAVCDENKAAWEKELAAFKESSPTYRSHMDALKKKTRHGRKMERLKYQIRKDCQMANCFVKLHGMNGWEQNPDEIFVLSPDYGVTSLSWEDAETHIDGLKVLHALKSD